MKPRDTLADPYSLTDAELTLWLAHGIVHHNKPLNDYRERNRLPPTLSAAMTMPPPYSSGEVGDHLENVA